MNNKMALVSLLLSFLALAFTLAGPRAMSERPVVPAMYDRIMKTLTLRCAYQVWEP